MSSSYEEQVISILKKEHIHFQREKSFKDLRKGKYRYDFYLTDANVLVELDGHYHFFPIRGEQELRQQKERDRRKNSYALAHNIALYRIPYWDLESGDVKNYNDIIKPKYRVKSIWHNDRIKFPKK